MENAKGASKRCVNVNVIKNKVKDKPSVQKMKSEYSYDLSNSKVLAKLNIKYNKQCLTPRIISSNKTTKIIESKTKHELSISSNKTTKIIVSKTNHDLSKQIRLNRSNVLKSPTKLNNNCSFDTLLIRKLQEKIKIK